MRKSLDRVVVRFVGDSGDGMQLTGGRFTEANALAGNDLATLPNYPAEIRAPVGTVAGVSGFQIQIGAVDIHTPGDSVNVLVAMNPAALVSNLEDLEPGGMLIVNTDRFEAKDWAKAGYNANPLEEDKLRTNYGLVEVPISTLTLNALADTNLSKREAERCKNFFTLGIVLKLFNRSMESTTEWISTKFKKNPELIEANILALKAGSAFCDATEVLDRSYSVKPAKLEPGIYRNINGTLATALGFIAAVKKSGRNLFFGAYPITPASDLLHEMSRHKLVGVTTFQAEDEISAICASIGAAYAGQLAVTSTSGPGFDLKSEPLGLATMAELPLVCVDVQRSGPSTGLPTKTEQSDLLQAMFGRHGECPVCVLSASSPSSAFVMAYEACRIATKYMTPVIFLSEGYVANCSEPWNVPTGEELREFEINEGHDLDSETFKVFKRSEKTFARAWVCPGDSGFEHRIGGLEKMVETGDVCYLPENHDLMVRQRAEKIARIAEDIPKLEVDGPASGKTLVLGWGGTEGSITRAIEICREEGMQITRAHLNYLNPFPSNLEAVLNSFEKVIIPETNLGQLSMLIRAKFGISTSDFNRVTGMPIKVSALVEHIKENAL